MAKPFEIDIVTPVGTVFTGEIWHVRAPGSDGDFGVLADHAPLMAGLRAGRLRIDQATESSDFVITGGFFEVHDNRAVVLAENCLRREDIDLERAQAARERALQTLAAAATPEEQAEARIALDKATAIIKFAENS
ncbi:MAG TPA: ATP synthase F1 subunit epsilon [bacterium]|jgi:F-type H+-transporting ATPase subunit epsilon